MSSKPERKELGVDETVSIGNESSSSPDAGSALMSGDWDSMSGFKDVDERKLGPAFSSVAQSVGQRKK